MKNNTLIVSLTACLVAATFTACDKTPAPEAPAAPSTNATAASTVDAAKDLASKAVDTAKDATAKAVDSTKEAAAKAMDTAKEATAKATDTVKDMAAKATDAVKNAVTPAPATSATAQFTEVVTNTKQFIADKNYQGALDELKKLSDVKLSDDQQKIVDGLKAEAQKMLSAGASSAMDAAKNMLNK